MPSRTTALRRAAVSIKCISTSHTGRRPRFSLRRLNRISTTCRSGRPGMVIWAVPSFALSSFQLRRNEARMLADPKTLLSTTNA